MLLVLLGGLAAAGLVAPTLDRVIGRATGWVMAAGFTALLAIVLAQGPAVLAGGETIEQTLAWMPELGVELHLRMDGTAWLFSVLVTGIGALVLAYAARYFPPRPQTGFYFFISAFAASMQGLVLADDIIMMFVFWELTTICSFFLIGISGVPATRPAVRTYILTALGGLALLGAVIMLVARTGTTRLSEILADETWRQDSTFTTTVVVLVIVAIFTKSAQFPFHYWLPDAMAASTPVSTYLHADAGDGRAIGIYNPRTVPVDLAGHALRVYPDGNGYSFATIPLMGQIPAQGTHTLVHSGSPQVLLNLADQVASISYMGAESIVLVRNGIPIDVFGKVGEVVGSYWWSNGVGTYNSVLVRKPTVDRGDHIGDDAFLPDEEWLGYPATDLSHFGSHTSPCGAICTPTVTITVSAMEICPGEQVTVTATALNEGSAPTYQWTWNNAKVGYTATRVMPFEKMLRRSMAITHSAAKRVTRGYEFLRQQKQTVRWVMRYSIRIG